MPYDCSAKNRIVCCKKPYCYGIYKYPSVFYKTCDPPAAPIPRCDTDWLINHKYEKCGEYKIIDNEIKEKEVMALVKVKIFDTLEETAWRSKLKRQCLVYKQTCENCRTFVPVARINKFYDTETVEGVTLKDITEEDDYYKTSHFKAINYLRNVSLKDLEDDEKFPPHFLKKYHDPPYPFFLERTDLTYDVFYFECRMDRSLDATVEILEKYIHLVDNCLDAPLLKLLDCLCSQLVPKKIVAAPKRTKKPSKIKENKILVLLPLDVPNLVGCTNVVDMFPAPKTSDCRSVTVSATLSEKLNEINSERLNEEIDKNKDEDGEQECKETNINKVTQNFNNMMDLVEIEVNEKLNEEIDKKIDEDSEQECQNFKVTMDLVKTEVKTNNDGDQECEETNINGQRNDYSKDQDDGRDDFNISKLEE